MLGESGGDSEEDRLNQVLDKLSHHVYYSLVDSICEIPRAARVKSFVCIISANMFSLLCVHTDVHLRQQVMDATSIMSKHGHHLVEAAMYRDAISTFDKALTLVHECGYS